MEEDIVGKIFHQNCGDDLLVVEKTNIKSSNNTFYYKCYFQKYFYEILCYRIDILRGNIVNPLIEQNEVIGNLFPQKCGDSLLVLKKEIIDNISYFECEFQKYPFRLKIKNKSIILNGLVNNPQIEQKEFVEKLWLQNCGDTLKILQKTTKKQGASYLWECEFIKYPCKVLALKGNIVKGKILNPKIEEEAFIGNIFVQNCGDSLKVIEKTNQKFYNSILFRCKFIKYPYEILSTKASILIGTVNNPLIEENEFIGKVFQQNCEDNLKVLRRTEKHQYNAVLFECEFQNYPCKVLATKSSIKNKKVQNPILPWKSKESLEEFIKTKFNYKPTLSELKNKLGLSLSFLSQIITSFELKSLINYKSEQKEKEVKEFLDTLNIKSTKGNFGKEIDYREIDILISDKNLGIEFNGNLWHSTHPKFGKGEDIYYHQNKTLTFLEKKNIFCLHIFEYEWEGKRDIIESLIKSKLGIFDKIIGARQCEVREINSDIYQQFCEKNHLQGKAGAGVKLGLFYKDELVQIMSFGTPRFTLDYQYEIIRECSKLGYCILGGKEKLWSYFVKNWSPTSVISYCDFSKFLGNSYLKLGFKKLRLNKPGFVWWDKKSKQIFWRTPSKNQEYKEKYYKIYDCGQLVFVWKA